MEKLVFLCVSLRADAEGQHLLGHDMAGRWKAEFAFDCYATFREVAKELLRDTDTEWIFSDVDVWFRLVSGNWKERPDEGKASRSGVSTHIQDAMNWWRTVEGSNVKICWGMAWHAEGKLEVAFDCDAVFRGATG